MGDDAEYRMELDAEARRQAEMQRNPAEGEPCRPLLCWEGGELGYIWDWEPGVRVLDIFSGLHDFEGIGRACFLSIGVPSELDLAEGLEGYRTGNADAATHEVIVLTPDDIDALADAASDARDNPADLQEEMVAGMLEAMVLFMEAEPQRDVFLFARTL